MRTYRLTFTAPVHFGGGRLTDAGYACDAGTLFSALFIEALRMDLADGLLEAAKTGDLGLSDAFPFVGDTLYLPKPMAAIEWEDLGDTTRQTLSRKAAKKLPYIPAKSYASFLAGHLDVVSELQRFKEGIGRSGEQTKVNLTRSESPDSQPYQVGIFRFHPTAGIYFVQSGDYDLRPLLDQLQYSGIGGERSSGFGRFTYAASDEDPIAQAGGHMRETEANGSSLADAPARNILLATAAPMHAELTDELLEGARYQLVRKGGFVQSTTHSATPQKKRDLYLFGSGSVFAHPFAGDVFDVNLTGGAHPVWRYARALWMEV